MSNPNFIRCRVPWCRDDQHVIRDGGIHHGASVAAFSRGGVRVYVDIVWAERPGQRSVSPHVAVGAFDAVTGECGWGLDLTVSEARDLARILDYVHPFAPDLPQFAEALANGAATLDPDSGRPPKGTGS